MQSSKRNPTPPSESAAWHLLVATDGEAYSEPVLQAAAALARIGACKATVLTVVKQEQERKDGEIVLDRAAKLLQTAVPDVQLKVRVGHPAEEIAAEAATGKYDLIVLGRRPVHGLLARIFGPVTEQVMAKVSQPVLIAKQKVDNFQRLLVCDSGTQQPPLLERFTAQLPLMLGHADAVTVLHVMSQIGATPGINGEHLRATAKELIAASSPEGELLERDMEAMAGIDVRPRPLVRHGLVVDEILDEADRGAYDLVVIGAHRQQAWPGILLDDLACQIIRQIEQTVLVIQ